MNTVQTANQEFLDRLQKKADAMKLSVLYSLSDYPKDGTVYYVAENGDDSNAGTGEDCPIRTISKVNALALREGDTVLFRRGDLFRGAVITQSGVTYSAYGTGDKPVLTVCPHNFARPELWVKTDVPNVWKCTEALTNVGIMTFDSDPRDCSGHYNALFGTLQIRGKNGFEGYAQMNSDLQFHSDLDTNELFLYSEQNPGERFTQIEIGERNHNIAIRGKNITIDNLHITGTGAHGVSSGTTTNLTVRNCIFDRLGGSILVGYGGGSTVRYGNAVEIYGGCDGYYVYNNWMTQIYDTGITHQIHYEKNLDFYQKNIEYHDNLIEYCFWSIEAYNCDNRYGEQTDIYVHDNFCRYGGYGWGCPGRETSTPMISFGSAPDVSRNYVTEHNIIERSKGWLVLHYGKMEENPLTFRKNIYVQTRGDRFLCVPDKKVLFDENAPATMQETFGETDGEYYIIEK